MKSTIMLFLVAIDMYFMYGVFTLDKQIHANEAERSKLLGSWRLFQQVSEKIHDDQIKRDVYSTTVWITSSLIFLVGYLSYRP